MLIKPIIDELKKQKTPLDNDTLISLIAKGGIQETLEFLDAVPHSKLSNQLADEIIKHDAAELAKRLSSFENLHFDIAKKLIDGGCNIADLHKHTASFSYHAQLLILREYMLSSYTLKNVKEFSPDVYLGIKEDGREILINSKGGLILHESYKNIQPYISNTVKVQLDDHRWQVVEMNNKGYKNNSDPDAKYKGATSDTDIKLLPSSLFKFVDDPITVGNTCYQKCEEMKDDLRLLVGIIDSSSEELKWEYLTIGKSKIAVFNHIEIDAEGHVLVQAKGVNGKYAYAGADLGDKDVYWAAEKPASMKAYIDEANKGREKPKGFFDGIKNIFKGPVTIVNKDAAPEDDSIPEDLIEDEDETEDASHRLLDFPETYNKSLDLGHITDISQVVLPKKLEKDTSGMSNYMNMNSLTTTAGLTIPEGVENIYLNGLTSLEGGLTIPKSATALYLEGITSIEELSKLKIPKGSNLLSITIQSGEISRKEMDKLIKPGLRKGVFRLWDTAAAQIDEEDKSKGKGKKS